MNKNTKKILALSVLFMFAFSFAVVAAQAATAGSGTPAGSGSGSGLGDNPIGSWFADWDDGNFSPNIAKYLLWALVALVVFGISDMIPGLAGDKMKIVRWVFAVIVGFLSMAYVTPDEVYAIMSSYSAMGFMIGAGIPFVILLFFTFRLASTGGGAAVRIGNQILGVLLWLGFAVFMVSRATGAPEGAKTLSWILAVIAIIMAIAVKSIMIYIWAQVTKGKQDKTKEMLGNAAVVERERSRVVEGQ